MPDVPDVMKAAVLKEFGGTEKLATEPVPVPSPEVGEVLIRVHTAGVGIWDSLEREGQMADWTDHEPQFPYILGSDGSGVVAAVGESVERFQVGDRVYASSFLNPRGGFYAEYVPVKEELVAPIPERLSMEEAGAMPIDAVTALRGLRDVLELREGETLLVFGASGGVGHMAVQLAKRMGGRILAVASGADGVDMVTELGADEVVEGREDDLEGPMARIAPNGIDAALVTASGKGLAQALAGVREGGRVAWPNGVHPEPEIPHGVKGTGYDGATVREILGELNRQVEEGPFLVHVDRTFSLAEADQVHGYLTEHYLGKIVLLVGDSG